MGKLIINEGCYDSLILDDKRNDNLLQISLDDRDMLINQSEAIQIIKHLQEQFNLPSNLELLEMLIKVLEVNKYHNFNGHLINQQIQTLITKATT